MSTRGGTKEIENKNSPRGEGFIPQTYYGNVGRPRSRRSRFFFCDNQPAVSRRGLLQIVAKTENVAT